MGHSTNAGIAVCRLLARGCQTTDQQNMLLSAGAPKSVCAVVGAPVACAQLTGLQCLSTILYKERTRIDE